MSHKDQGFAIVTHGGAGEPLDYADGCERAAQRGHEIIIETGDALEAAIAKLGFALDRGARGDALREIMGLNLVGERS